MLKSPFLLLMGLGLAMALDTAAPAAEETLRINRGDCSRLVPHVARSDVAYREGIDVHGKPVAPADLPGSPDLLLPEDYVFVVQIRPFDYVERRRLREDPEFIADALSENATELGLGTAVVTRDGRAYFNGAALFDEEKFELARLCREALLRE